MGAPPTVSAIADDKMVGVRHPPYQRPTIVKVSLTA